MKININREDVKAVVKDAILRKIAGYMLAQSILDTRK